MIRKILFMSVVAGCCSFAGASGGFCSVAVQDTAPTVSFPAQPSGTATQSSVSSSDEFRVISIFLDKIASGYVYALDGSRYALSGDTRIIDNTASNGNAPMVVHHGPRTAELFFKGEKLTAIHIKF